MLAAPERTFRVGCTSFVLPDFVLPNVEWLAGKVDDIQLLMVEPDGDLPSADDFARMRALAELYGHTYTVHLPDLVAVDGAAHARAVKRVARMVTLTTPVSPDGWVVHVDPAPPADPAAREAWLGHAVRALHQLSEKTGVPRSRFQVENQGSADLPAHREIVDRSGCALCLDVGHVLRDGGDPLAALAAHLPVVQHIHLHGVDDRDHRALRHFPALPGLLSQLEAARWTGTVTLEVFGREPFEDSLHTLRSAWPRGRP